MPDSKSIFIFKNLSLVHNHNSHFTAILIISFAGRGTPVLLDAPLCRYTILPCSEYVLTLAFLSSIARTNKVVLLRITAVPTGGAVVMWHQLMADVLSQSE